MKKSLLIVAVLLTIAPIYLSAKESKRKEMSPAVLTVLIPHNLTIQKIELYYYQNILFKNTASNKPWKILSKEIAKGQNYQSFKIPIDRNPGYISIVLNERKNNNGSTLSLLDAYLIETGDSIEITIDTCLTYQVTTKINDDYLQYIYNNTGYTLSFSGKGSQKFECRYIADRNSALIKAPQFAFNSNGEYNSDNISIRALSHSLEILERYKRNISPMAYEILKADFIGAYKYRTWIRLWRDFQRTDTQNYLKVLQHELRYDTACNASGTALAISRTYANFIFMALFTYYSRSGQIGKMSDMYQIFKQRYGGIFRDRILTSFLIGNVGRLDRLDSLLKDAVNTIETDFYKKEILQAQEFLGRGKAAYNFSLPNEEGVFVSLSDYFGKVVFIDFWFTGCKPCKAFYQENLSKIEEEFKTDSNVVFITISVDRDRAKWIESVKSESYTSPRVINLYTGGMATSHPVIEAYKVSGYPRPILIDRTGKIYASSGRNLRNKEGIRTAILQALRNENSANPHGWGSRPE
jgi:thiol-disulfide isomerase/thioredoxin